MGLSLADKLAERIAPKIFDKVAPDLLNVLRSESVSDGKGGQRKGAFEKENRWLIPCIYEPGGVSVKDVKSNEWRTIQGYKVKFPRIYQGRTVDIKTSDRIEIQQRGLVPVKILKIEALRDYSGVYFEAGCTAESI